MDISLEIERQKALEKELSCKFIRTNPGKKNQIKNQLKNF